MKLPKSFVEKGLKLSEGAKIFGIDLNELSRDELIAAAAMGWDQERKAREQSMENMKFLEITGKMV